MLPKPGGLAGSAHCEGRFSALPRLDKLQVSEKFLVALLSVMVLVDDIADVNNKFCSR